eukprot:Skav235726  [mRNA]  locus=scaffold280:824876:836391:+ [translate_table: standard]
MGKSLASYGIERSWSEAALGLKVEYPSENAVTQHLVVLESCYQLKQASMEPSGVFIGGIHISTKTIEVVFCMVVVMVMLRLELLRRTLDSRPETFFPLSADKYKKLLRECGPEAFGTLSCAALVVILRFRGDTISETLDGHSREAWESIKAQWPVLLTADTLLAIQVMLRLVVILSALLRSGANRNSPVLEECAALWCGGAVARCFVLKRSQAYWLEGPVGGLLPALLEALLAPLLFMLGHRAIRRSTFTMLVVSVLVAIFAKRNNLNLAEEEDANILFMAAHCFEFLSALLYAGRTMLLDNDSWQTMMFACAGDGQSSLTFMHLVMIIQQSLAAYFWLQAFDPDANVNGSGLGILAIQMSCLGQLCAYIAAASLHVMLAHEGPVHASL